jgi:glycosyltransferase involved in cell wall biosynthesis
MPNTIANPLRIAFLTAADPRDRRSWSGTLHFMAQALAQHCGEVLFLGPIITGREKTLRNWNRRSVRYLNKRYDVSHSLYLSAAYAHAFAEKLARMQVDVIYAPASSTEVALLRTKVPIVYMSDTTFALMRNYYPGYRNLLPISYWEADFIESRAIRKASKVIYPSQWAGNSAIRDYGADPSRIHIFPMGANMQELSDRKLVESRTRSDHLRMLFVGVDWERKGGSIALDALIALRTMGIPAKLTVVGCTPPAGVSHPDMVVVPFLDKNKLDERTKLAELYFQSDLFILPTRAECGGIVFCEANAYGLPVLATDTGGVRGALEHNVNGFLFPESAGGDDYALAAKDLWENREKLESMAVSSREAFEARLNWDAWGIEATKVLRAAASSRGRNVPG